MVKFAALEESGNLLHMKPVCGHVGILRIPISGTLLYHQIRIAVTNDPMRSDFLCDLEPMDQSFVLSDVI